ncbi:MAG: hypothetical protein QS721_14175 [Candidatus Endonucleobacter sp. (ex Gigantidas childressi)]|nr:hypothetical protein [Candidatus Endonucleobacter sp. (ex Gigantidas childressi)]
MHITKKITDQISASLADGVFKIDDDKKAITLCLGGRHVEALVVDSNNKEGALINVRYTADKKAVTDLYHAYKKSQESKPIMSRIVGEFSDDSRASRKESKKGIGFGDMGVFKKEIRQLYSLRHEIQGLTVRMKEKGLDCTGMKEDESYQTPREILENLKDIKSLAETALYKAKQPPTKTNIIGGEKKAKTDFKETNQTVIDLIKETEAVEARLNKVETGYTYLPPNPGDVSLEERSTYWEKRKDSGLRELSRHAGDKLRKNNPNITDLSDPNRPLLLAEKISSIYDNIWTDAMEDIDDNNTNISEEVLATILFDSLMTIHQMCKNNSEDSNEAMAIKEAKALNEIKGKFSSWKIDSEVMNQYIQECTYICLHMLKNDPPMVFGDIPQTGEVFNKDNYKPFTTSGTKANYVVWPSVHLYQGGPLLGKGIVQPIKGS